MFACPDWSLSDYCTVYVRISLSAIPPAHTMHRRSTWLCNHCLSLCFGQWLRAAVSLRAKSIIWTLNLESYSYAIAFKPHSVSITRISSTVNQCRPLVSFSFLVADFVKLNHMKNISMIFSYNHNIFALSQPCRTHASPSLLSTNAVKYHFKSSLETTS